MTTLERMALNEARDHLTVARSQCDAAMKRPDCVDTAEAIENVADNIANALEWVEAALGIPEAPQPVHDRGNVPQPASWQRQDKS